MKCKKGFVYYLIDLDLIVFCLVTGDDYAMFRDNEEGGLTYVWKPQRDRILELGEL